MREMTVAFVLTALLATTARSEEPIVVTPPTPEVPATAAPETPTPADSPTPEEAQTSDAPALEVKGFVDGSFVVPMSGYAKGSRGTILGLDQAEVDVIARPASGVEIRIDLNWFPARSEITFDSIVEQARVDLALGSGWFLRFGKLNAPLGIEMQDPTDMFQFSYSPIFSFAQPSNLTGLFVGWGGDAVEVQLFASNDWDTPSTPAGATAGARVAVTAGDHVFGLTAMYGPVAQDDRRLLLDLDVSLVFGDLTLWVEGVLGQRESELGDTMSFGGTLKGNYKLGDHSVTLRGTYLKDEAGIGGSPELGETNLEVTAAWLFPIMPSVGGLVEVRADVYDEGDPVITGALELTASF